MLQTAERGPEALLQPTPPTRHEQKQSMTDTTEVQTISGTLKRARLLIPNPEIGPIFGQLELGVTEFAQKGAYNAYDTWRQVPGPALRHGAAQSPEAKGEAAASCPKPEGHLGGPRISGGSKK